MTHKLLSIIRLALGNSTVNSEAITSNDWPILLKIAVKQGVLAIVWDGYQEGIKNGLISPDQQPSKGLKLQWALNAKHIEKRYRKQLALASELSKVYAIQGIGTIVLKGLAISRYYPTPEHRECGDLDCFLVKLDGSHQDFTPIKNSHNRPVVCYDEGNQLAKDAGADVKIGLYG